MIRFALVVASVLGFVLTAALGNMMVPLLRELQRAARGTQPDSDAPDSLVPTMGGLCLMVGTLAAVGVGWLAACAVESSFEIQKFVREVRSGDYSSFFRRLQSYIR